MEIQIIFRLLVLSWSCSIIIAKDMPSLHHLHKLSSHEVTTAQSLCHGNKRCKFFISHLLKSTQQTSLEEHLS